MKRKAFSFLNHHWNLETVVKVLFPRGKASVDFTSIIYTVIIEIYFNLNKNECYRPLKDAHIFTFSRKKFLLTQSLSSKQKIQRNTGRRFNRSETGGAQNRDIHTNLLITGDR